MIDEVAEVKDYLDGKGLDDPQNYYRACYMITKYYKKLGLSEIDAFQKVAEWVRKQQISFSFSLAGCVGSAFANERELRCGTTVRITQDEAETIKLYSSNKQDKRVALALLCCAKAYADRDGVFMASSCALASWLGMDSGNLRNRQIRRLERIGYMKRVPTDSLRGWQRNYYRSAYRFRLLVPYGGDGPWELVHNDIRTLYEQIFREPY